MAAPKLKSCHTFTLINVVIVQLVDRGGASVQSKTKSLTPFVLRSNREDLAALCKQAAAPTVPDHQALTVTDQHRSVAESISTSPQVGRRTLDQRLTSAQVVSSKKAAGGSSASLDARSKVPVATSNRSWGLRIPSATSAGASAASAGSEYGLSLIHI